MRQKRAKGSHFANDENSKGLNDLVIAGKVDPTWLAHSNSMRQELVTNSWRTTNVHGNMSILVGAQLKGWVRMTKRLMAIRRSVIEQNGPERFQTVPYILILPTALSATVNN